MNFVETYAMWVKVKSIAIDQKAVAWNHEEKFKIKYIKAKTFHFSFTLLCKIRLVKTVIEMQISNGKNDLFQFTKIGFGYSI